jgi:hypothetical protein
MTARATSDSQWMPRQRGQKHQARWQRQGFSYEGGSFETSAEVRIKRTTMEEALHAVRVLGPRVTEDQLVQLWLHDPVRCAAGLL